MIRTLLDNLAARWLNYRRRCAVRDPQADPALLQFDVDEMTINKRGATIMAYAPGIALLADEAAALLDATQAKNFLQFDMCGSLSRGVGTRPIRVTVQWAKGKSPSQMLGELEDELAACKDL